jgi:uroporphyrinogen decarboxylase
MTVSSLTAIPDVHAAPNFDNLLKVLRGERPSRPTLFEFFLNIELETKIAFGHADPPDWPAHLIRAAAFRKAGYDYLTVLPPGFAFPAGARHQEKSISLNEGGVISDWDSFHAYPWQDPDDADYAVLDEVGNELADGMMIIPWGPGGVEENVISLVGYENLCFLLADEPELVTAIFEAVGSRLVRFYEHVAAHPRVGACISNDDWGFKTQTLLSVAQMREYLFPWHQRIVETIHAAGKPAILHSCGYYGEIIDTVIDELRYDARHSYEDGIQPVEAAYDELKGRIAVLGGLDLDFVCRAAPEEVYARAKAMLRRAETDGGYALGTGNSVPEYVPHENYFAMIRAATDEREG